MKRIEHGEKGFIELSRTGVRIVGPTGDVEFRIEIMDGDLVISCARKIGPGDLWESRGLVSVGWEKAIRIVRTLRKAVCRLCPLREMDEWDEEVDDE